MTGRLVLGMDMESQGRRAFCALRPWLSADSLQPRCLAGVLALRRFCSGLWLVALIARAVVGAAAVPIAVPAVACATPAVSVWPAPSAEQQYPQQRQEEQREEEEPEPSMRQQE